MSIFNAFVNLCAYACFTLGTLLVWPSRHNILAWLAFPFFIIAYVIPLAVIDYGSRGSQLAIDTLTVMNALGALSLLIGLVLGSRIDIRGRGRRQGAQWETGLQQTGLGIGFQRKRVINTMLVGCALMSACFWWMGVVPMFANEPFLAKFFRGEYKVRYDQVSVFYRFGQTLLATALPAGLVLLFEQRTWRLALAIGWALLLFAVSLNRGTVAAGALLLIGVWSSRSRWRMAIFVAVATLVYAFGSSVYAIIGIVVQDDFNPWVEIARGAPDVTDHLIFLDAFMRKPEWSYGLTFFGGLIPGTFHYNPAVFTLAVLNDTSDVSEIASGGLRLPPSLSGYAAFGWAGALTVPFLSGLIAGVCTTLLRALQRGPIVQKVAALLWYQVYALFFISFYTMSYLNVIAIFVLGYISTNPASIRRFIPRRRRRAGGQSSTAVLRPGLAKA